MMNLRHTPVPLAIVGGGAAGLFAAAEAASHGKGCLLFEAKARPGAKMLMTANGRCNFTKDISADRMLADIGAPAADFLRPALTALPPSAVLAFFRRAGLRVKRMTDGRLFPASEKAADVVHVFGDLLRENKSPMLTNARVTGIQPVKNGFIVATRHFTVWAEKVLLATGGMSFPKTGSTGDGIAFAQELGHAIEPCRAGLTGFDLAKPERPARYEAASARIEAEGRICCRYEGEVEFDATGVTGAAVYNCQRQVARLGRAQQLGRAQPGHLHSEGDGQRYGGGDGRRYGGGDGQFQLVVACGGKERVYRNPVARPLKEAIVTIGGVARSEVDPATMMSRKVPGLYFAGEMLDVDGPTGGYNLTIAFATAHLAVQSALGLERKGLRQ